VLKRMWCPSLAVAAHASGKSRRPLDPCVLPTFCLQMLSAAAWVCAACVHGVYRAQRHLDTAATSAAVELLQHLRGLRQLEGALISVRLLDRMHGSSEKQWHLLSDAPTAWLAGVPALRRMQTILTSVKI
jgi:hypothetical protein